MATGLVGNAVTTKRTKTFVTGIVTNDVVYTCPAGAYAEVYISDIYASAFFSLTNLKLVASGGAVPNTTQISGSLAVNAQNLSILFVNAVLGSSPADGSGFVATNSFSTKLANGNFVGDAAGNGGQHLNKVFGVGSVFRLFPGDFISASYNGISSGATLSYSTIEVSSST